LVRRKVEDGCSADGKKNCESKFVAFDGWFEIIVTTAMARREKMKIVEREFG
jgi:hypothetical protein